MEIIFTSNLMTSDTLGFLYAVHHDGTPVPGWPLRPRGWTYLNGATVADVDGDDTMDIIAVTYDNGNTMSVYIWETNVQFSRERWQWQTYQFDMARTGLYQRVTTGAGEAKPNRLNNNLPISPTIVRPGARLKIRSPLPGFRFRIYDRDGRLITETAPTNGQLKLPAKLTPGVYFIQPAGIGSKTKLMIIE
jgi:hypothetical protein